MLGRRCIQVQGQGMLVTRKSRDKEGLKFHYFQKNYEKEPLNFIELHFTLHGGNIKFMSLHNLHS